LSLQTLYKDSVPRYYSTLVTPPRTSLDRFLIANSWHSSEILVPTYYYTVDKSRFCKNEVLTSGNTWDIQAQAFQSDLESVLELVPVLLLSQHVGLGFWEGLVDDDQEESRLCLDYLLALINARTFRQQHICWWILILSGGIENP